MKSIFFISANGFPSSSNKNSGIFTYEQAKVASLSHSVLLIDLQSNKSRSIYQNTFGGVKIHRLLYTRYNLLKIFKNLIYLYRLKKKFDPILIICSFLNLRNVFYSLFLHIKTVTIIHGSDAIVSNILKKIIYNLYLKKNHKIFVVSKFTKKILLKYFKNILIKKKVNIVFNGFSKNKLKLFNKNFAQKLPKLKILISCVANAVPRKNILFLVELFKKLNSKKPNKYHLFIAGGSGPETNKIKYLINYYRLKNHVTFKQNLFDSEISTLLKLSKFFCLFSKEINREFEGFGIVFLEAMYTKNIIFSTKHGGIQDIIQDGKNGYLFNIHSQDILEKIIKKIEFISKNKKIRKKIIMNAYSASFNFSWEKNINEILNLSLKKI